MPVVLKVLPFLIAFVLTRPPGATAGDLLTKPVAKGVLNLGTLGPSDVLLAVLFEMLACAQARERRAAAAITRRAG
ncbi:hypothetical protein ABZ916_24035 [Streptomyces sp. NPDC046853]|uniref:hypothetical protein n=1 Tax=Streptomyces sp. NPDC046853 TaxID=3154920 RepID=UPI0033C5B491